MKGTLFSSDYVFDTNGNAKIIEVNTDTGFVSSSLTNSYWDSTAFKNVLTTNNISELDIVYKKDQQVFVDWLTNEVSSISGLTVTEHLESQFTIYPSAITDSSDKFILRLAYDEAAIFDSIYCKNKTALLDLMNEYTASDYIPPYFSSNESDLLVSSSLNNTDDVPDVVIKSSTEQIPVVFAKVGHSSSSSLERYQALVGEYSLDSGSHIEQYLYASGDLSDGRARTVRSFDVLYGTDLQILNLGRYSVQSVFEIPSEILYSGSDNDVNYYDSKIQNTIDVKHSFEFGTKYMTMNLDGIYALHSVSGSVSSSRVDSLVDGDNFTTFYIEGAPDTEDEDVLLNWSVSGKTLPANSYVTSSVIETVNTILSPYKTVAEVNLNSGNQLYSSYAKLVISYNTSSNEITYKPIYDLTTDDYLYTSDGTLDQVTSTFMVVANEEVYLTTTDVEAVDNLVVSGSNVIIHNAPCFIAGTKINTEEGIKNIEDVTVGEKVITYNHDNDTAEYKEVLETMAKDNESVITYKFENGTELTATPDHPLFVNGKGYCSYDIELTKKDSGLVVEKIEVGDEVLHLDGYGVTINEIKEEENKATVYNLKNIKDNHNFYANEFLVHNRITAPTCFAAGTKITLADGSEKNIEDIVVGDVVKGWDSTNDDLADGEVIGVDSSHTVASHAEACKLLGDEPSLYTINDTGIEFTPEHPFLTADETVEGGPFVWKSLVPDSNQEPYKSEQKPLELKVGDSISHDGEWVEIESIKVVRSDASEKVYNITVKDLSSYIANGIIVHNK